MKEELYTYCLRCGRKLRSYESQKLGFGKICYNKWESETKAYQVEYVKANHRRYAVRRLF